MLTLTMREAFSLVWAITPLAYMGLNGIVKEKKKVTPIANMMELELMDHIFGLSSILSVIRIKVKGHFIFDFN